MSEERETRERERDWGSCHTRDMFYPFDSLSVKCISLTRLSPSLSLAVDPHSYLISFRSRTLVLADDSKLTVD